MSRPVPQFLTQMLLPLQPFMIRWPFKSLHGPFKPVTQVSGLVSKLLIISSNECLGKNPKELSLFEFESSSFLGKPWTRSGH